jgi:4-methyl-5(b-hydroxyethyl)-thiazole monophosphate biosynthesis
MNYILLANGFEEIEAISVIDILRRASIDLKVVSINDTLEVISDRQLKVLADITIDEVDENQLNSLILPGGSGHKNLEASEKVIKLIKSSYDDNKYIFAICAAPSILGKIGLLEGKNATAYPGFEKYLEGAKISSEDVCVDGKLITSRGPGTAHKFAYKIVETLSNKNMADQLREGMLFN